MSIASPTLKPKKITYDKWVTKFKPIKNHLKKQAPFEGLMFETFGEELDFIKETPPDCVWTVVEGDTGKWYIIEGYHHVNRIGYLVTTVPFEETASGYSIFYM